MLPAVVEVADIDRSCSCRGYRESLSKSDIIEQSIARFSFCERIQLNETTPDI